MRRSQLFIAAMLSCGTALAQDVSALGGLLSVSNPDKEKTFSAALSYTHPVGDYVGLSLTYLNEGHPDDHHRDGFAPQFWLRTHDKQRGLTLGVGVGQYFYFDTASLPGDKYTNDHGWAGIYSLQATWHFDNRWYAQAQLNRILPGHKDNKDSTTSLMVGAGYRFDGVPGAKLHLQGPSTDEALTVLAGQGISNSFYSERFRTGGLEYRRAVGKYVDLTLTALNEGNTAQTQRNGVAAQLWLIRSLNTKVELGMGAGPYFNATVPVAEGQRSHKAGLVTIGTRYHFTKHVVGELMWNRVVSDYHRDADLLLVGLGYTF
ncbi:hypothetical protein ACLB1G_19740 [Oxalobacteraceae bacterium A2-2]